MNWFLVIENSIGERAIFQQGSREEMLQAIETRFETGALSGKRYVKRNMMLWEYLDRDKLYLVNEKGLEKLGYQSVS